MKQKTPDTTLTDHYLTALDGMRPAETGAFFYTRLQAKMSVDEESAFLSFKPVWTLALLAFFLLLNGTILLRQHREQPVQVQAQGGTITDFAAAYDQTLSPSF